QGRQADAAAIGRRQGPGRFAKTGAPAMSDWKPVAVRGRFAMVILSLARARAARAPIHAEAALVAELRPDDAPPLHMSFVSVKAVQDSTASQRGTISTMKGSAKSL